MEKNGQSIFDELIFDARSKNAKMVFISNPLAQLGSFYNKKDIVKLIKSLLKTIVVVNEAYIEYVDDFEKHSCIDLIGKFDNLVVLTMSNFLDSQEFVLVWFYF